MRAPSITTSQEAQSPSAANTEACAGTGRYAVHGRWGLGLAGTH